MLLLRAKLKFNEEAMIEFYFDDIIDVDQDNGVTIVSWGDDVATVLNNTVEAVAEDIDPMIE